MDIRYPVAGLAIDGGINLRAKSKETGANLMPKCTNCEKDYDWNTSFAACPHKSREEPYDPIAALQAERDDYAKENAQLRDTLRKMRNAIAKLKAHAN